MVTPLKGCLIETRLYILVYIYIFFFLDSLIFFKVSKLYILEDLR